MPKINPLTLPVPKKATPETRTFTDPRHPGQTFSLTLRATSGLLEEMAADDLAEEYVRAYVGLETPILVSDSEGVVTKIEPTPALMNLIARLVRGEVCTDGDTPYGPAEWLHLAHRAPDAFTGMVLFQEELQKKERARLQPPKVTSEPSAGDAQDLIAGAAPVFPTAAGGA